MSDIQNTLMQNRSVLNPTDAAMMKQDGEVTPDMTVRDYFAKLGVDVDGPVTQLVEMGQREMQKANPMNKMQAISGGPQGKPAMGRPQGQPAPMAQGRAPEAAGLSGLLKNF